MCKSELCMT